MDFNMFYAIKQSLRFEVPIIAGVGMIWQLILILTMLCSSANSPISYSSDGEEEAADLYLADWNRTREPSVNEKLTRFFRRG